MSDSPAPEANNSNLRQPKKRFVGRRTAEAQAQQNGSQNDVETTTVQKGEHILIHKKYTGITLIEI